MGSDTPELPTDQRVEGLLVEPGGVESEAAVGGGAKRRPRTPKSSTERRGTTAPKGVTGGAQRLPNPCLDAPLVPTQVATTHYEVVLPFTPSTKGLTAYANHFKHVKVMDRRVDPPKVTFDDKALTSLSAKYPDAIYSHLAERREIEKCLGTYVRGIVPFIKRPSGRLCGEMAPTTLTLRLAQRAPSLLNLPRVEGDSIYNVVREMYVAAPGHTLMAVDYSGVEAVLVGYLAKDPTYIRLAKMDPHSFFVSHIIGQPADLAASDEDLAAYLHEIKGREKVKRQAAKKIQHAANYGATAHKAHLEEPRLFPKKADAQRLMDLYHGLFPSVGQWHTAVCDEIEAHGFVTAPSGFRLHYTDVYDHVWSKEKGRWERSFGASAKEAFAAVPQHLGAVALMGAAVTMCREWPEFRDMLRLLIHDEMLAEVPEHEVDLWDARVQEVMKRPLPYLPLPPEWGMGTHLSVNVESKRGNVWAHMR